MKRRSKKKRTPSKATRLRGERALTAEDQRVLERLEAVDDLADLVAAMAEADTLLTDYRRIRKLLPVIDAALAAQDFDNLPAPQPKSPAERRRQWQEKERELKDAACRSVLGRPRLTKELTTDQLPTARNRRGR